VEDLVLSLSAKGLTNGEISPHLAEVYGADVSKQTMSTITDKVMDGMVEWQNRPLDRSTTLRGARSPFVSRTLRLSNYEVDEPPACTDCKP
jgi:Transposase, Mutator family